MRRSFSSRSVGISVIVCIALLFSSAFSALFAQDNDEGDSAEKHIFLPLINSGGPQTSDGTATLREVTNQMVVRYHSDVQVAAMDHAAQVSVLSEAAEIDVIFVREMSDNAIVVKLPSWMKLEDVRAIADRMLAVPEVDYAEPDTIMYSQITPKDTQYGNQWHYFAPTVGNYGANLPGAWDITTGSASVVVAVIDTGILLNHADLAGRTVQGYDFINDSLVANDGSGRDSDPSDPGDWITSAESASGYFVGCPVGNSSWHGSHVAGTIAANSNNALGVAGINWQARILPVRVLGKCGGYTSDIVDAIRWSAGISVSGVPANANPADVINMSLGGSGACSTTEQNAINAAVNVGTVVVVAAGNSNANAANYSPASCANIITVASTNRDGGRAYYSNYGTAVEISAPGGDTRTGSANGVLSTSNTGTTVPGGDSYAFKQGTSMATPHIVGVVSLMFSLNPNLTPAQVTSFLQSNVTRFPAGSNCTTSTCGAGIVNAAAVVSAVNNAFNTPPRAFAKSSPGNGGAVQGASATLSWGTSSGATSYEYCIDTNNNNACDGAWVNNGAATSATLSNLVVGSTYYWQVRALNTIGSTEADSSAWWNFNVQTAPAPGAFNKSSPSNGQTRVSRQPTLRWGSGSGATRYEYCIDTNINGVCDSSWVSAGTALQVAISLQARTTYSWQVRAVNPSGATLADGGTWWSFTTR